MGGFSESDLVVLTRNTLNQSLIDYVGPDVEFMVFPVNNEVAPATQSCLQLPTLDALTRSGDSRGILKGAFRAFSCPGLP
jgi:hypothetical protein